ncbi:LacI family transcriptional regulator [Verrucomicrobia bacterium LW23]|nr:LacI family transcriptional regulator [Verrucomicrobia bacterium LW23]
MANLKTKRQNANVDKIAFITSHPTENGWRSHQTFTDFFEGAKAHAFSRGYALEAFWLKEPGMTPARFSRMLYTRNIHGVLIAPLPRTMGHLSLDWDKFAASTIGHTLRRPDISRAVHNHYRSMVLALRNLRRLGYRRIGYLMEDNTDVRTFHTWLAAYLVYQHTLPPQDRLGVFQFHYNIAKDDIQKWLKSERPDAIVAQYNEVLPLLLNADVSIPDQIGFASLNTGWKQDDPAGINQHQGRTGEAAVDLIIGQLNRNERGIPAYPRLLLEPGSWVNGPTVRRVEPGAQRALLPE